MNRVPSGVFEFNRSWHVYKLCRTELGKLETMDDQPSHDGEDQL